MAIHLHGCFYVEMIRSKIKVLVMNAPFLQKTWSSPAAKHYFNTVEDQMISEKSTRKGTENEPSFGKYDATES